jgi:hypothetical protein
VEKRYTKAFDRDTSLKARLMGIIREGEVVGAGSDDPVKPSPNGEDFRNAKAPSDSDPAWGFFHSAFSEEPPEAIQLPRSPAGTPLAIFRERHLPLFRVAATTGIHQIAGVSVTPAALGWDEVIDG